MNESNIILKLPQSRNGDDTSGEMRLKEEGVVCESVASELIAELGKGGIDWSCESRFVVVQKDVLEIGRSFSSKVLQLHNFV